MIVRRRSLMTKRLVAVVLLWLGLVIFFIGDHIFSKYRYGPNSRPQSYRTDWGNNNDNNDDDNDPGVVDQRRQEPVIARPDPERLRFEASMRSSAEQEARFRKQATDERQRLEEGRRVGDRVFPPFMNMQGGTAGKSSSTRIFVNGVDMSTIDDLTKRLIQKGLIIPKWNLLEESAAIPNGTGEFGVEVTIVKENLSEIERKELDDGWKRHQFNQYLSDRVSIRRALPDVRDPECQIIRYRDVLPSASVIIIFYNEAWTTLLRTVHSVLDRSPPHLIKEIILVDDFSELDHLKKQLDDYVTQLEKVRVMRGKKREGLIRARLLGASVATAEVLIFLDSHCECTKGWLEPLLDRIADNRSNVVVPIIDVLDDDTLAYHFTSAQTTSVGGFDWNLQYNWHPIPDREKKRRKSEVEPVWSPVMAGGLFGISRKYFEYLGTYDPGMDIWGGENLELSFRIWMCGGTLEIIVCSHVGHIFRKTSPYLTQPGMDVVKKNSIRMAEVWMDGYGKYYYERFNNDLGDYGDVRSRKELRKRLNCKSFEWYLKNIYPELFLPSDALATGEIRNKMPGSFEDDRQPACVDSDVDQTASDKPVKLWPCHNQGGNQYWMLSKEGEIRRDDGCIDYTGESVMVYPCHGLKGNQEWIYGQDNTLRHNNTNLCLQLFDSGTRLEMMPCTGIDHQIWYWSRRTDTTTPVQETSLVPMVR